MVGCRCSGRHASILSLCISEPWWFCLASWIVVAPFVFTVALGVSAFGRRLDSFGGEARSHPASPADLAVQSRNILPALFLLGAAIVSGFVISKLTGLHPFVMGLVSFVPVMIVVLVGRWLRRLLGLGTSSAN